MGVALDPECEDCTYKMTDVQDKIEDIRVDVRDGQSLDNILERWNPDF